MNERLEQLAVQAKELAEQAFREDGTKRFTTMEKFAELIVRECAQTLRDNTPVLDEYESEEDWDRGYGQAMKDCVHHIQEHFGVEE